MPLRIPFESAHARQGVASDLQVGKPKLLRLNLLGIRRADRVNLIGIGATGLQGS